MAQLVRVLSQEGIAESSSFVVPIVNFKQHSHDDKFLLKLENLIMLFN